MPHSPLIYCIVDADKSYMIDFNRVKENSANTVRYNKDKSKCVVKFIGENTNLVNIPLYRKDQIVKILKNDEWK